jgi:hypothetical protein
MNSKIVEVITITKIIGFKLAAIKIEIKLRIIYKYHASFLLISLRTKGLLG